jgi:formylglycine-generating enzyme required for sulfatase activity
MTREQERRSILKWLTYGGMGIATTSLIGPNLLQWIESSLQPKNSVDPVPARDPSEDLNQAANVAKQSKSPPPTRQVAFTTVQLNEMGQISSRSQGEVTVYSEDLGSGIRLEMASIPRGTFVMGSPAGTIQPTPLLSLSQMYPIEPYESQDEKPEHSVAVPRFWIGQFEVTQAQWRQVAAMKKVSIDLPADPSQFKGKDRPVDGVSWDEAVEFCARLSRKANRLYRLPSEAEWEYACRAGTKTPFSFGSTLTSAVANYDGNGTYRKEPAGKYRKQTTDVGSFPANAFGLYDMHGNVLEWCQDLLHDDYSGAPTDGSAQQLHKSSSSSRSFYRRVLRGGAWNIHPSSCRSATRGNNEYRAGFRVACSLDS